MCRNDGNSHCDARWTDLHSRIAIEFKCIYPSEFKSPVVYKVPPYYVPQILANMFVLSCTSLWLCFYSKMSMVIMECNFDEALWNKIWEKVKYHYDKEHPLIVKNVKQLQGEFKDEIDFYCITNSCVIGEFPVLTASEIVNCDAISDVGADFCPYFLHPAKKFMSDRDLLKELNVKTVVKNLKEICCEGIQHCRNEATDIIAFVVADSTRIHRPGIPPHIPIAYGMRGPSLSTVTVRKMISDIKDKCKEVNARIVCDVTDGEFIRLANHSDDDAPLTHLQRARDLERFYDRYSRKELLDIILQSTLCRPAKYPWQFVVTPTDGNDVLARHNHQLKEKKQRRLKSQEQRKERNQLTSRPGGISGAGHQVRL